MKLNFTEFSYGYSFTENLIRWSSSGPIAAPVFPNLVQEAQLGYDVKIDLPGLPLFFQFKLPELMVRKTAREKTRFQLTCLSVPFFRMALMRRDLSDQHKNLIDLEKQFANSVFYAAPTFLNATEFNDAYSRAEVHLRSFLFSPENIGSLPDNEAHSVVYSRNPEKAWRCSEAKKLEVEKFEVVSININKKLDEIAKEPLEKTTSRMRDGILPLIPPELRAVEADLRKRIEERREVIERAVPSDTRMRAVITEILTLREFVRVGLGVDMLIAQPREPRKASS
jgi:hypothetical protein